MPRACSSSFRAPTQSSSQVPSTLTLRLLRRCLSNCSSDSFSQAYFRRGIGSRSDKKRYLDGVTGCCRQQPPSLRGVPLFSDPRRLWGQNRNVRPSARCLLCPSSGLMSRGDDGTARRRRRFPKDSRGALRQAARRSRRRSRQIRRGL